MYAPDCKLKVDWIDTIRINLFHLTINSSRKKIPNYT